MNVLRKYLAGLVVFAVMAGCAPVPSQPDNLAASPTLVATATSAADVTDTPRPTVTPFPSPTRRATATPAETSTGGPTLFVLPTFTIGPTNTPIRTLVPTRTQSLQLGLYTATPNPLTCDPRDTYPLWGQAFPPRTDFVAKWHVYNVGSAMWRENDIVFEFVEGEKMQNRDRGPSLLPFTVYVNDKINLQVHLKSPKEPGVYFTTWGLRKTNKAEYFCKMILKIVVAGK